VTLRAFVEDLELGYLDRIREGMEWIGLGSKIGMGDTVFVKPNLTYPMYRRGVMTSPEFVKAMAVALKDYEVKVIIGEADSGGYNRFSMDEVLYRTGIKELEGSLGVRVVNLSHLPHQEIEVHHGNRTLHVPLPTLLLDDVDFYVTTPVPKIHMNTKLSGALKNQWGCIPKPEMRLKLHPYFGPVVRAINRKLNVGLAVFDGRFGLDKSGPLRGNPRELGWILMVEDPYVADLLCCRLLGLDARKISYLRKSEAFHLVEADLRACEFNRDLTAFQSTQFHLKRDLADYLSLMAFQSRIVSYLAYYSPFADLLHKILYFVREPYYDYKHPEETRTGQDP
jgi:uncharacterized protein (DUF362 family)